MFIIGYVCAGMNMGIKHKLKEERREKVDKEDEEQLKELMGLIFNLYCECDHTNWEKHLFKNEKLGGEITGKIAWLEKRLWDTLVDLEDSFGLSVKEVEIGFESLIVKKKEGWT